MTGRDWIRAARYGFTLVGIVALVYSLTVWVEARLYQARAARRFSAELQRIPVRPQRVPSAAVVPTDGGLIGRLEIPRIGVSVMVVEGVEYGDLKRAVGHIPGTAFPGEHGNVGIAGHRDTFFRPLRLIHRDDTITLSTLAGAYSYRVVATKIVMPGDVQVLYPTRQDALTLVTCYPFNYVGSAPRRFIVCATRPNI